MAQPVANTPLTATFGYLVNRVNELANCVSNWALTTDGNGSVISAAGNAALTGTLTANNLMVGNSTGNAVVFGVNSSMSINSIAIKNGLTYNVATGNTSLTIGNSTTNAVLNLTSLAISNSTANIVISSPTATQVANSQFYLNANGSWVYVATAINQTNTSGTSTQVIDSWLLTSFRTADYIVHVKDNVNNNHVSSKLFATHDNTNGYITEYAKIVTNTAIGAFTVSTNSTALILNYTPNAGYTNNSVTYIRTLLT